MLALSLVVAAPAWADYYIVVGEESPVVEVSQRDILHLYLGRARNLPGSQRAVACDLSNDSIRAGFYRALNGMSLAQLTSYWARLTFSGRNLPPEQLESEAAMVERLQRDPAAIGWLPSPPTQAGLRTVLVLKAPR
jgi:hypothetical protein